MKRPLEPRQDCGFGGRGLFGVRLYSCFVAAAFLTGCSPPIKHYEIREPGLSCAEANRLAHDTLVGMGFAIRRFDPAAPGGSGRLQGTREVAGGGTQSVTVDIDCKPSGVEIDASEDGKVLGQIEFKRGFYISFGSIRSTARAQAEMDKKMVAGTAPPSLQRGDVRVLVTPVRGQSAKLDFALDMAAGGILPVRIAISNLTERSYRLDPDDIRLTRADRQRATALSPEEAAGRVVAARKGETGEPVTTLSREQVAERLRAKLLKARTVVSRSEVVGFLYFPLADYTRARVLLTEAESGETEGFMVEF